MRLRDRKLDVTGMNILSAVHDHIAGGDAQRGVRGGDFACGGGPLRSVLPGSGGRCPSQDCDNLVDRLGAEEDHNTNWNRVRFSGVVVPRVQQKAMISFFFTTQADPVLALIQL